MTSTAASSPELRAALGIGQRLGQHISGPLVRHGVEMCVAVYVPLVLLPLRTTPAPIPEGGEKRERKASEWSSTC